MSALHLVAVLLGLGSLGSCTNSVDKQECVAGVCGHQQQYCDTFENRYLYFNDDNITTDAFFLYFKQVCLLHLNDNLRKLKVSHYNFYIFPI